MKNPTMKQLLTEWRKVLKEETGTDRELTPEELDMVLWNLQSDLGTTISYGEPEAWLVEDDMDTAVKLTIQIGYIDHPQPTRDSMDPGGEFYPTFENPNEQDAQRWVEDLVQISGHTAIGVTVTDFGYNGEEMGNGYVNAIILIDQSVMEE